MHNYVPSFQDKLSSQDGDSSSQDENESDDRGYYSLSKTDSSQNQSGSASIQPLQDNLTVIQKNHRSNRRKALRESSTLLKQQRKAQKNYIQVNYYVSSLGMCILDRTVPVSNRIMKITTCKGSTQPRAV